MRVRRVISSERSAEMPAVQVDTLRGRGADLHREEFAWDGGWLEMARELDRAVLHRRRGKYGPGQLAGDIGRKPASATSGLITDRITP